MSLDFETMIDRIEHSDLRHRDFKLMQLFQGTCLVLIEAASFAASTLLIVLGLPLFVFLFLAGWDLALLFAQLGNLADHYSNAEPLARLAFSQDLKVSFVVSAGGFTLLRIPAFLKRLARRLGEGDPDHG